MNDFPEGFVWVIGGSGGVGAEVCREFARSGTDVMLTYKSNSERAVEVVQELRSLGRRAECHMLSIADNNQIEVVVEKICSDQRLHTVVIAAGSDIEQVMIRDLRPEQWQAVVEADLNGFFNIVRATLPHMKKGGGGSYVHLSSAGLHRWPDRDVLSVAPKAAIESLIQGIAHEEGRYGIRANSVALGVIEAGIFLRLKEQGVFDSKWEQAVQAGLCIKRWGKAEEVAHAAVYLASQRAAYVTGQMISVDGGYGV